MIYLNFACMCLSLWLAFSPRFSNQSNGAFAFNLFAVGINAAAILGQLLYPAS